MCRCKCVRWMVLEWNMFEDVVCSRDFNLYSLIQSASGRSLPACVLGDGTLYAVCLIFYGPRWYTQNRQSIKAVTRAASRTS